MAESDVTNILAQTNCEDKFGEVMNRTAKEFVKYFHFLISSRKLTYPLSSWGQKINEQSQQ